MSKQKEFRFIAAREYYTTLFPFRDFQIPDMIFNYHYNNNNNNNNYYYFISYKFITPVLTGGFSLKSEWQQVSSDPQDSSKYPSWF